MRREEADHELGFDVNGDIKASRDYIINQGSIQGLSFCVEPEVQRVGASCLGTLEETFDLMTGEGLDWRYIGFGDPQDNDTMCNLENMRSYMAGVIMEAIASISVVLV